MIDLECGILSDKLVSLRIVININLLEIGRI